MPLLPYITETDSNMSELAMVVKAAGADFFMPGGLTLRPGVQKETFLNCLEKNFPQFVGEYESIYVQNRQSGAPAQIWHSKVTPLYQRMIGKTGKSPVIPHHVFKGLVPVYEEVYLVLSLLKVSFEYRLVDTRRLSSAINCYRTWVGEIRRPISRSRKRSFLEVDEKLAEVCTNDTIGKVLGNEKLGVFVRNIVLNRALLDGVTLKLI